LGFLGRAVPQTDLLTQIFFPQTAVNELSVNAIQGTFSTGLWIAHVWYYTKVFGIMTKIECRDYNGISSLKTLRIM